LIITGSAEPKLIIGRTWTPPFLVRWVLKSWAVARPFGFPDWPFDTTWIGITVQVTVQVSKPCLEFWESESKCRLDRETGSSLHYACGCTSIDCQDLKWRTAEGNCRPIPAALHLWGDGAAFFFFFWTGYILKLLSNSGYWKSPKKLHNFRPFIF
jgi:hypothetical protein